MFDVALSERIPGWYAVVDQFGNVVADCIVRDSTARKLADYLSVVGE